MLALEARQLDVQDAPFPYTGKTLPKALGGHRRRCATPQVTMQMCTNPWNAPWDTPMAYLRYLDLSCNLLGAVFWELPRSSVCRPKCYRQNDRTDRGTTSCFSLNSDLSWVFTRRFSVFACEQNANCIIWHLGGSRRVQHAPTGCGNTLPTFVEISQIGRKQLLYRYIDIELNIVYLA